MPDQLAQACTQFEALMLKQLLTESGIGRSMAVGNDAAPESEAEGLNTTSGCDMMQSMFVDALAQAIAGVDRAGLGRELARSLRGGAK